MARSVKSELAIAVLAVFALATVSASLDTVSTQPTITSDPPEDQPVPPAGAGGGDGDSRTDRSDDSGSERETGSESTATRAPEPEQPLPLWQVVGGLGLFLLGSVAALYALTDGVDTDGTTRETIPVSASVAPPADSVTLGTDVPASNDVYRVWNAFCADVPIDPAGETPATVAAAAVEAGYRPGPVVELTDTFCEVRYGEFEPTGERQRRARELASTLSLSSAAGEEGS